MKRIHALSLIFASLTTLIPCCKDKQGRTKLDVVNNTSKEPNVLPRNTNRTPLSVQQDRHDLAALRDRLVTTAKTPNSAAEVDELIGKIKTASDRSDQVALDAITLIVDDVSDNELIQLIDKHSQGVEKVTVYSGILSYLSNSNLERLSKIVNDLPPSAQREIGFRCLYRKMAKDLNGFKECLLKYKGLSEPEDVRGAAAGLLSAKVEMINSGIITMQDAEHAIDDSGINAAVASELKGAH